MGRKDTLAKKYMKKPEIFADFFNGYIYNGESVVKADLLQEVDTSGIGMIPCSKDNNKRLSIQKYRDIIKRAIVMKTNNKYLVLLGIENQTDIHYAMPVRNMLYNALSYNEQVDRISEYNRKNGKCVDNNYVSGYTKEDKLLPVITVTLYWGTKPWDAPVTLKEMLIETDENTSSLVDDVNCNLFSIVDIQKLPEYQTELKELFSLLRTRNDSEAMRTLVTSDEEYKHIDKDTAEMMREFADLKLPRRTKEGYDMCKAVMELKMEGQRIGEQKGMDEARVGAIKNVMRNGNMSFEKACELLGIEESDKVRYEEMLLCAK